MSGGGGNDSDSILISMAKITEVLGIGTVLLCISTVSRYSQSIDPLSFPSMNLGTNLTSGKVLRSTINHGLQVR